MHDSRRERQWGEITLILGATAGPLWVARAGGARWRPDRDLGGVHDHAPGWDETKVSALQADVGW
jgi:hypothetical protein